MKVYVQNKEVTLTDKDFISEGGEGKIYGKDALIYKIYHEPSKMIPIAKITELQSLTFRNIVVPKDVLTNGKGTSVGFSMPWVKNTVPLCKLFTNDYRNRFSVNNKTIIDLIESMANTINHIHSKNILMVDGNEMNYLISTDHKVPVFIDTDSYQTLNYPATAIMPSIRDHHSSKFSEMTDWFSFAIVSFQLFIGIHPYKGTHSTYKKSDLEGRMKNNISVFNSDVKVPAMVRDFGIIPDAYKNWYMDLFEKGKRTVPPIMSLMFKPTITHKIKVTTDSQQFILTLLNTFDSDIIRLIKGYVVTINGIYDLHGKVMLSATTSSELIFTNKTNTPIRVDIVDGILEFTKGSSIFSKEIKANDKMIVGNSVYVLQDDKVMEVELEEAGIKIFPVVKSYWNVLPNATQMFNGVIYQNILGKPWFMIHYKTGKGQSACSLQMMKELEGYKILECKRDKRFMNVIASKGNVFDSFFFKFDSDVFTTYTFSKEEDVTYHVPNFIVLDNGTCIRITVDDEIQVFRDLVNILKKTDSRVNFESKLCSDGNSVYLRDSKKLYQFKMK